MSASDVQDSFLVSLLEAALEAEVGIRIPSNSGSSLKSLLYRIRRQEPRYQVLRLTTSPDNPDEIWIVHKRHYTPTQGPYARETQINFEDLFSEE